MLRRSILHALRAQAARCSQGAACASGSAGHLWAPSSSEGAAPQASRLTWESAPHAHLPGHSGRGFAAEAGAAAAEPAPAAPAKASPERGTLNIAAATAAPKAAGYATMLLREMGAVRMQALGAAAMFQAVKAAAILSSISEAEGFGLVGTVSRTDATIPRSVLLTMTRTDGGKTTAETAGEFADAPVVRVKADGDAERVAASIRFTLSKAPRIKVVAAGLGASVVATDAAILASDSFAAEGQRLTVLPRMEAVQVGTVPDFRVIALLCTLEHK